MVSVNNNQLTVKQKNRSYKIATTTVKYVGTIILHQNMKLESRPQVFRSHIEAEGVEFVLTLYGTRESET